MSHSRRAADQSHRRGDGLKRRAHMPPRMLAETVRAWLVVHFLEDVIAVAFTARSASFSPSTSSTESVPTPRRYRRPQACIISTVGWKNFCAISVGTNARAVFYRW